MTAIAIKPRWTAITISQVVDGPAEVVNRVSGWGTVYMFDRNEVTRYCSQQKLYMLKPLYNVVDFYPGVEDEEQESIREEHFYDAGDDDYFDEGMIERLIANGATIVEYGDLGEDETEEDVREYWQGNCPL
jgi:hypothetical protein